MPQALVWIIGGIVGAGVLHTGANAAEQGSKLAKWGAAAGGVYLAGKVLRKW